MDESQNQFCNLCKRHCPVTNLQCNRGQSFFVHKQGSDYVSNRTIINETNVKEEIARDTTENKTMEYKTKIIKEDIDMNNDLMTLLYRSSHFLHHRRGGKRGQRGILTLLAQNPEISQKELQDRLGIESGSMSELVIKLEHKGLITRTKDDTDKRMSKLTITDLGLRLSKELEETASGEEQQLLSALNTDEQEQLQLLLTKLVSNWEESYNLHRVRHHHGRCGHHEDHGHHADHGHHRDDNHPTDRGHHADHGHHGDDGHHGDHDHHSDRSAHEEEGNHHHHGQDRDLDRRGHHFSGKEHDKHHHHRHK